MAATATRDSDPLAAEEAGLARAAATGDGGAFAALYERYGQRAFNLAYRISGSKTDAADAVEEAFLGMMQRLPRLAAGEADFGSQLFAAAHNACHDLMGRRQRRRLTERGQGENGSAGSNGTGPDADPDGVPGQDELREANMRLPERQREALALRELEDLSYSEIAAIMETNPDMVAQLLSRARINLCDELHGTILASIGAPSQECERALPLLAMREDGQFEAGSRDAAWLDSHLAGCERCRVGIEAMRDASSSYRAWAPVGAAPWLFRKTMANAAVLVGADWSEKLVEMGVARTPTASQPGTPSLDLQSPRPARRSHRRAALASGLAALLIAGGLAAALAQTSPRSIPAKPTAGAISGARAATPNGEPSAAARARRRGAKNEARAQTLTAGTAVSTAGPPVSVVPGPQAAPPETRSPPSGRTAGPGGTAAVQPGQPTSAPKPSAKQRTSPTPSPAAQPAAVAAPTNTEPPTGEESPKERHRPHEPPGKPADRPPR
jgi:RNA polymerase sigma factor (sigma-70 family)